MNLGHHEPNSALAQIIARRLERLRMDARISARDLSALLKRHPLFIDGIESVEPITLADFLAVVWTLGHEPSDILSDICERWTLRA